MNWSTFIVLFVALVAGYILHSKVPGLVTKVTGGLIAA
jgi:hypothetical protein